MSKRWIPASYDDWKCTDPDAEGDEVSENPCHECHGKGGWRCLVSGSYAGSTTWVDCKECNGTGNATDCEDEP